MKLPDSAPVTLIDPAHRPKASEAAELQRAAQQFEALFVHQLLKSMRQTVPKTSGDQLSQDMFTDMLDEQLAQCVAESGGIGLAKHLTPKEFGISADVGVNGGIDHDNRSDGSA